MSDWLPVETAPKDGTKILGLMPTGDEIDIYWSEDRSWAMANAGGTSALGHLGPGWADVLNGYICDEPLGWKPKT